MKLETLTLENFRCHEHLEIQMAPVMLVTGENGTGKSTCRIALQHLFHGAGPNLAKEGTALGRVTASWDGREASRDTGNTLAVSWEPSADAKEAQRELEIPMHCSAAKARLCLGNHFPLLDGKAQKGMLNDLLRLEMTPEMVAEALQEMAITTKLDLHKKALELAGGHRGLVNMPQVYKKAFADRTEAKRAVKELKVSVTDREAEGAELVFVPAEKIQALEKDLALASAAVDTHNRAQGAYESAARQVKVREQTLEQLRAKLAAMPANEAPRKWAGAAPDAMEAKLKELRRELQLGQAAVVKRDRLKQALDDLREHKPCPTCGSAYEATTSDIEAAKEAWEDSTRDTRRYDVDTLRGRIKVGEAKVAEWKACEVAVKAHAQADLQQAQTREHIKREEAALESAKAEMGQAPAIDLAALRAEVKRVTDELQHARAWSLHKDGLDRLKDRLATAEAEAATLHELCGFFNVDGFQAQLLRDRLDPFVESINGCLSPWQMSCRFTGGLDLEVVHGQTRTAYDYLSDGEQILVGLALQCAFASLTGLRIVIVDRLEALDDKHQRILLEAALSMTGMHHILLLGVRCVDPPTGVHHIKLGDDLETVLVRELSGAAK